MRWVERDMRKVAVIISIFLFLLLLLWIPSFKVSAQRNIGGAAAPTPTILQATPTPDLTVTVLAKQKLREDVDQGQHTFENWFWANGVAFLSVLVIVGGGLIGYLRWRADQRTTRLMAQQAYDVEQLTEKQRAESEREIVLENHREAAFQAYIDKMSELLLHEKLRMSQSGSEVREIARVRTLTVLTQLDGRRKGNVLQFLHKEELIRLEYTEEGFINYSVRIISLEGADLSRANLIKTSLRGSDLGMTDLSYAKLHKADLEHTNLELTRLRGTDLSEANLRDTRLIYADFSGADLSKAILDGASFEAANLEEAGSLQDTRLHDVRGLSKGKLKACKAKGAIIDEATLDSSTQPPTSPPPQSQQ
jgi:uncharacterized protein YjbI with pentapeptide repeats